MSTASRPPNGSARGVLAALACAALLCHSSAQAATAGMNHVHLIDAAHSWLKVHVGKVGLFSFAGDEHQVDVPIASGSFDDESNAFELTIDAAKMRVLDPPSRMAKVQTAMLGTQVLDVARYPTISFRSTGATFAPEHPLGGAPRLLTIEGKLTLHGQTHPISVIAQEFGPQRFTGSTRFKQTQFGITPIKVAGGAVRVKDDLDVVFDIQLK